MSTTLARGGRRSILGAAVAVLGIPLWAWSQAGFPQRAVRMIVPFPAGQGSDTSARILAARLVQMWGQQVLVENRPGGLGIPGMLAAKAAVPDGYTLLIGATGTLCINPAMRAHVPYNVARDFVPVSNLVIAPLVIIVHPEFAARSLPELFVLSRKTTQPIPWGSAGVGTSQHLTGALLASRASMRLLHVPYKGSAPAITDLIGGQIPLMIDSVGSALPHIRAGRVRALAVTTLERISQLPDIPTVAENGFPGFEGNGWASVMAPAGTPRALVEKISADVQRALRDPKVEAEMVARGVIPAPSTPAELGKFLRTETEKWTGLARAANIRLED